MSESHSIRNGIISTVVGGVILAILGAVWPPAAALLKVLWSWLTAGVQLPVWALGVAVIGIATALASNSGHRRRESKGFAAGDSGSTPTHLPVSEADALVRAPTTAAGVSREPPMSALERQILERLVKADGQGVSVRALQRATGVSQLRLQAELERLVGSKVLEWFDDAEGDESHVYLTPKGRQYLVRHGLL